MNPFASLFQRRLLSLGGLVALVALALGAFYSVPALAGHRAPGAPTTTLNVQPTQVDGNKTCSQLLPAGSFLFEHKFEPVSDRTVNLSHGNLNGTLTVDETNGQTFDFKFTGNFGTAAVFAKGGPDGNLYDYRPQPRGAATADTRLHSPVSDPGSPERYYGLSHISFCLAEVNTSLRIEKDAVDDTITPGEKASFAIRVTNTGTLAAQNVVITDTLPTLGGQLTPWYEDPDKTECTITSGNNLRCDLASLAPGASFSVTVSANVPAGSSASNDPFCDQVLNNRAFARADNADPVDDDASISIQCGGVKVVKTAKHADSSGQTSANLRALFRITDYRGITHDVYTDATTGLACVDNLPLGAGTVREIEAATGYALNSTVKGVTVSDADCPNPGDTATATIENDPLTDVTITIDSQHNGATLTRIRCWVGTDTNQPPLIDQSVSDGSASAPNLLPTDPNVTLTCQITIDP